MGSSTKADLPRPVVSLAASVVQATTHVVANGVNATVIVA